MWRRGGEEVLQGRGRRCYGAGAEVLQVLWLLQGIASLREVANLAHWDDLAFNPPGLPPGSRLAPGALLSLLD
ncbi:hypothetical protein NDU88_002916 [Pleurodeles waltl]|uniref:Uncharacterized protein n=1 Tax=Pleurodeles waltl TaxID=8319 RepID=A0AAV7P8F0_PLEWA|nr:hypothetical protein NDU88_002916 [Pleurodeles waltl]